MNTLVLIPRTTRLDYAVFGASDRDALLELHLDTMPLEPESAVEVLHRIRSDCRMFDNQPPQRVLIRCPFGGDVFQGATVVDPDLLHQLDALSEYSPLHIPRVRLLSEAAMEVFTDATVAMVFETAFFVSLPESERRYAIGDATLRRYGYHGLFHQAACMQSEGMRPNECTKTLSLCLEPRPELAAVIDQTPVMVTSGTTPLEGLPGETSCGEIDPSIILTLAKELKWGPEQINTLITRQSGMFGLTGHRVRLGTVMAAFSAGNDPDAPLAGHDGMGTGLACAVLAYRILLAAGAGVAAMGGVDRIVISGQYVHQGRTLAGWLSKRLQSACRLGTRPPVVENKDSLARILADQVPAKSSVVVG